MRDTLDGLIGFRLIGMEPATDRAWLVLGSRGRMQFYREQAKLGLVAKLAELRAGLDAEGQPLTPISNKTRQSRAANISPYTGKPPYSPMGRAKPSAPPLQATGRDSRTQTLLKAHGTAGGVFFTWGLDAHTGKLWSEILARHATGFFVKFRDGFAYVPPRDVFGLGPRGTAWVKRRLDVWWIANRARLVREALGNLTTAKGAALGPVKLAKGKGQVIPQNLPPVVPPPRISPAAKAQRIEVDYHVVTMGQGAADIFGRRIRGRQKVYTGR